MTITDKPAIDPAEVDRIALELRRIIDEFGPTLHRAHELNQAAARAGAEAEAITRERYGIADVDLNDLCDAVSAKLSGGLHGLLAELADLADPDGVTAGRIEQGDRQAPAL